MNQEVDIVRYVWKLTNQILNLYYITLLNFKKVQLRSKNECKDSVDVRTKVSEGVV